MNKLSIIIPALGGEGWTGGQIYQENLIEALRSRKDVSIYIINNLIQQNKPQSNPGLKKIITKYLRQIYLSLNYQLSRRILGYDRRLSENFKEFSKSETNVLFTNNHSYLDIKSDIIKLYWIPDFQHIHLPYLFTPDQIAERNYKFLEGCKKSDVIILSSKDAQKDLANFAPEYLAKSRVSHFAANVPQSVWEQDPGTVIQKYSIPEKYFYLPNQFWKHKNHLIVFESIFILKERGVRIHVVCTGNPSEFRSPEHFNEIKAKISSWDIGDQIHLLGLVPHDDVLLLLRQSIAMINPSIFEGWSTTVEECKSVGKKAILSDIPVHREQSPYIVEYFPPTDALKLSELLEKTWMNSGSEDRLEREDAAKQAMLRRIENYANNFFEIIKDFRDSKLKMYNSIFETPILFLIFNRPEHTLKVFETLKKLRPSKLFIAADGPRKNIADDLKRCEEARQIINLIDWDCDLKLQFHHENMGTKDSISSAINWFFENVSEGIILEDDCLPDESFFNYCKSLLEHYRNDERVMHINGTNFLLGNKFDFDGSYYFSNFCHPWGWATWKRAWTKYDIEMKDLESFISEDKLSRITKNKEAASHYYQSLQKTSEGKINTWDYQWFYTVWATNGIAITPVKNLICNIGFDKEATHTNYKYTRLSKLKRNKIITITHPENKSINSAADEFAFEVSINEGRGNLLEQAIAKLKISLKLKP